ncbi:MAG: DUF2273 domain-containing protein [Desulfitobacteriaceae bacterium]|nr:DUF2273 domain-containing protein [Desulfitobacteriaceae bacterium]MDD4752342.1 DUF2273 domain-containing protein [Desulfitobacteriaceae bacterium]
MDWLKMLSDLWTYHKGKTVGVIIGLLFGLMVVVFGFFQAFFIMLCMVIGYIIGRRIDDNINFKDVMDRVFRDH